jgi:hypothetical protein
MGNSMKKSNPVARQQVARELTPEQKQEAMVRFFTQKRESFTTGILFNLCQNPAMKDSDPVQLVDNAIEMADHLIEKLYPLKEESETVSAE